MLIKIFKPLFQVGSFMNYEEFDKKFNKCDGMGITTHTTIISAKGEVIFEGTLEECEAFEAEHFAWINDVKCINGFPIVFNGFTNVCESLLEEYYSSIFK